MKTILFAAAATLTIPAVAVAQDDSDMDYEMEDRDGTELVDRSINVRSSNGMTEEIEFEDDGVARIRGTDGLYRNARYTVDNDRLCFDEDDDDLDRCYAYSGFNEGQTYRLTDTNGTISDVTLQYASSDTDTDRRYLSASYGERG